MSIKITFTKNQDTVPTRSYFRGLLIQNFHFRYENRTPVRLSNLPKAQNYANQKAGTKTQVSNFKFPPSSIPLLSHPLCPNCTIHLELCKWSYYGY